MPDVQKRELPLRAVAMILISVAILLGMWGIYSLVGGKNANVNNAADSAGVTSTAGSAMPAAPTAPGSAVAGAAAGSTAPGAPAPMPAGSENAAVPGTAAGSAANTAGATNAGGKTAVTVHVLNNSTIQGLAGRAKDQLASQGYRIGQVGNYSNSVVPQNTVYYTDNEQQARELADTIGGVALQRPNDLPQETSGPGSLVVVLATSF